MTKASTALSTAETSGNPAIAAAAAEIHDFADPPGVPLTPEIRRHR